MTSLGKQLFLTLNLFLLTACSLTINSASENTPDSALAMETALAVAAETADIPRPTPTSAPPGTIANPLVVGTVFGDLLTQPPMEGKRAPRSQTLGVDQQYVGPFQRPVISELRPLEYCIDRRLPLA